MVQRRLAACAHVGSPITSTYWWKGGLEESVPEWPVVLKTTGDRMAALIEAVRAAHPYDTPEIVATRIEAGDPDYLAWVEAETRQAPGQ